MKHVLIFEELIALGLMRLQEIWAFSQALVCELYVPSHKTRLYLLTDFSKDHPTFHVQQEKPHRVKIRKNIVLALRKHGAGHMLKFENGPHEQALTAYIFPQQLDLSLIFDFSRGIELTLRKGGTIIAHMQHHARPNLHTSNTLSAITMAAHKEQAQNYNEITKEHNKLYYFNREKKLLLSKIKKLIALKKNLKTDQEKCLKILEGEEDAELIRVNLYKIKKGSTQVLLTDYNHHPPREKLVILDPQLTPAQLLEQIFTKLKKSRRGISHITPRLIQIEEEIASLQQTLVDLEHKDYCAVISLVPSEQPFSQARSKKPVRLPYRVFCSSDGIPLWVGKSARDNDVLTLRHARGKEWWFHVRDGAGSHVIVKCCDDALQANTMLEAAVLAAHFSAHKNEDHHEIVYTRIKYVKKIKGLSAGKVLLEQEKSLFIRLDTVQSIWHKLKPGPL